jgi:anti-anti-sigma factor
MKNNLVPQTGRSAGASILGGIILRNPFLALRDGNTNPGPAVAREARQDGIGSPKQVLKVTGYEEMTAANCNQFGKAARAAWDGQTDIEIDLSETTFIDCAGLGALIAVRNLTLEHNGVARLVNPTASVQQMLDLTRTGQLFDIVNTPHADLDFGPAAHN